MEFNQLARRAVEIRQKYDQLNLSTSGRVWEVPEYAQAFVGDVGQLVKLLMMKQGWRAPVEDLEKKIEHELSDCLWAVLVIADKLGIDLEQSFPKNMDELEKRI